MSVMYLGIKSRCRGKQGVVPHAPTDAVVPLVLGLPDFDGVLCSQLFVITLRRSYYPPNKTANWN